MTPQSLKEGSPLSDGSPAKGRTSELPLRSSGSEAGLLLFHQKAGANDTQPWKQTQRGRYHARPT